MSRRQELITLIACILGSSVVFLDSTVVNVALPAIREDLDAGLATQQWVVEAYLLTLGSLLLLGGSLSDLFGRRRVFLLGTGGFALTTLLCALAPNAPVLVAARAVQGIAGALLVPSTLAIVVATFPPERRGKAIGTWTAWSGISTIVGPLAGGALVDAASWRWVFYLSLLPALVTLLLVRYGVRDDHGAVEEGSVRPRLDLAGGALSVLGLGGTVFALIERPNYGTASPLVFVPFLVGLICLVLFVLHERRTTDPMLPLALFKKRNFAAGNVTTLMVYAGLGGAVFFLALYLQQIAGYSAFASGLALAPITVALFTLSRRFGAFADRYGPRLPMGLGPVVAGIGLILLVRMDADVSYVKDVLPGIGLFALGLSATVAPLTTAVLADAEERYAGVASGVNNAIARVAGLLAVAAVGTVIAAEFSTALDDRIEGSSLSSAGKEAVADAKSRPLVATSDRELPSIEQKTLEDAFTGASVSSFRVGIGFAGLLVVVGGLVSLLWIRNPRSGQEDRGL